jgi:hypothetical protein
MGEQTVAFERVHGEIRTEKHAGKAAPSATNQAAPQRARSRLRHGG